MWHGACNQLFVACVLVTPYKATSHRRGTIVCLETYPLKPATHLAILHADRDDRRKSPDVPGAAIAIFADLRPATADIWHVRYRRLNSPNEHVSPIFYGHYCESPVKPTHQVGRFYHMTFQNFHNAAIGEKKSPSVSASIKFTAIGVQNRQVCRRLYPFFTYEVLSAIFSNTLKSKKSPLINGHQNVNV